MAPDINATVEVEPETRTSLSVNSSGAGTIYWNPADTIDVFFGTKKASYISQNSSNALSAIFKTTATLSDNDYMSTNIWGLYPSNSSSTCDGSSVTTTFPSTQYGVPNTFDDNLFPAIAHSTSTSLQFYNVCGGIKFSLSRNDIKSITFRGNNNAYLAGDIRVTFSDGLPQATVVKGVREIKLIPKQGQTFASGKDYYIITLPTTLSSGFEMTFLTTDGTIGTFHYTGSVTIKRSVFSKKAWIDSYVDDWAAPTSMYSSIYWSKNYGDIEDRFEFTCEGGTLVADPKTLYQKIFYQLAMDQATFEAVYPEFIASYDETDLGTVEYISSIPALRWSIPAEQLWSIAYDASLNGGDIPEIEHKVAFRARNGAVFVVILKAEVKPVQAYKVPSERYIANYWTSGEMVLGTNFSEGEKYEFALYNVYTPAAGETASSKCLFNNNINAAFYTDQTGVINLEAIPELNLPAVGEPGVEIASIKYFFCKEMEDINTIGDFKVKFEVSADSVSLMATILNAYAMGRPELKGVTETIATINNEAGGFAPNIVSLNKESIVAKALLNTMNVIGEDGAGKDRPSAGELYIYIGAIGKVCGDDNGEGGFEVNLYWPKAWYDYESWAEWQDHFAAKYRQPVYLSRSGGDYSFIDAVDFGQGGSFITVKDLVNPKDWRARPFDEQKDKYGNVISGQVDGFEYFSNYWQYYGPFDIQVDLTSIRCNLGDGGIIIGLPVAFEINAGVSKQELKNQIVDLSLPYREKDQTYSGLTIGEKIDLLSGKAGEFGFLTYKNNGPSVNRDFELYVPVRVTYGWGSIEQYITVKVFKNAYSFSQQ